MHALVENMVFCDIVQNDKKCPMWQKMVQCDMNVWNDTSKLRWMIGMTCPKWHKIVIKDSFSSKMVVRLISAMWQEVRSFMGMFIAWELCNKDVVGLCGKGTKASAMMPWHTLNSELRTTNSRHQCWTWNLCVKNWVPIVRG